MLNWSIGLLGRNERKMRSYLPQMFASVDIAAPWPQYAALTLPACTETSNEAKNLLLLRLVIQCQDLQVHQVMRLLRLLQRETSETLTLEEEIEEEMDPAYFVFEPNMKCLPD